MYKRNVIIMDFGTENFEYSHSYSQNPLLFDFKLHNHIDANEILIFLGGDAEFRVEGSYYPLEPYDIILARNFEMHRVFHKSQTPYERIVIMIKQSFFIQNECESFNEMFSKRPLGISNKIPAAAVTECGIDKIIKQTEAYIKDGGANRSVINSKMIELLYNINKIFNKTKKESYAESHISDNHIKDIIIYINSHLTEELSLEEIAERFYITKCHLCRLFKQHTGYTVNGYITHKRLIFAREIHDRGCTWMEASTEAGFGNYSNFYKMFRREYGTSPKNI